MLLLLLLLPSNDEASASLPSLLIFVCGGGVSRQVHFFPPSRGKCISSLPPGACVYVWHKYATPNYMCVRILLLLPLLLHNAATYCMYGTSMRRLTISVSAYYICHYCCILLLYTAATYCICVLVLLLLCTHGARRVLRRVTRHVHILSGCIRL